MKFPHFLTLFFVLTLFIPPALAAEPAAGNTPTLDTVIADALGYSEPALRADLERARQRADATEAGTIDNPELQVDLERERGQGGAGISAEFFQPLKLSQLNGSRSSYADALRNLADSQRKMEALNIINEVATAYMKLWSLQARQELYGRAADEAKQLSSVVQRSAKEGQTAEAARELFSGDRERLLTELQLLQGEAEQARFDLAKLTGRSFAEATLSKPVFSQLPSQGDVLVQFAGSRSNWRNLLREKVTTAEQRLNVAENDGLLPEFGPRLIYSRKANGEEEAMGAGVALKIPLWNQNDAERERAKADLSYARTAHERYQAVPPRETINALLRAAQKQNYRREKLEDSVLPRYRKSYALTLAMFRQGQAGALELWQVREKLYQTEEAALESVVTAYLARLRLEAELGGKLEEVR